MEIAHQTTTLYKVVPIVFIILLVSSFMVPQTDARSSYSYEKCTENGYFCSGGPYEKEKSTITHTHGRGLPLTALVTSVDKTTDGNSSSDNTLRIKWVALIFNLLIIFPISFLLSFVPVKMLAKTHK